MFENKNNDYNNNNLKYNNNYDNNNSNNNNDNLYKNDEPKNNFQTFISKIKKNYKEENYNNNNNNNKNLILNGIPKEIEENDDDEIEIKQDNKDTTPITFRYRVDPNNLPFSVQLSGSFEKWQVRHPLKYDNKRKEYIGTIRIKKGRYLYKYYIDGQWVINMNEKIIRENGIENNVVIVY